MTGAPTRGGYGQNRRGSLPAAVLFDLDGTLIDSEPLWFEAETLLLAEHGKPWSARQAQHLVGWSLWDSATFLREQIGVDLPNPAIIERMQAHVIAGIGRTRPWRPGALELLAEVRAAGVPAGLVTMSYQSMTDVVRAALPVGSFQTVVTGDEVTLGKPHPDPYLLGAERLGVAAADCVAIEDSLTGATSALAAGCAVLLVSDDPGPLALLGVAQRISLVGMRLSGLSDLLWSRTDKLSLPDLAQSGSSAGSSSGVAASG